MQILWNEGGYNIFDIVPHLGTDDPVEVKDYLDDIGVGSMEKLIQVYGPNGPINDTLKLVSSLGALLWGNGYNVQYVKSAMPSAGTASWFSEYAQLLKQMTDCTTSGLGQLPLCATGSSTFKESHAMQAMIAVYGLSNLDCSEEENWPACFGFFTLMIDAGMTVNEARDLLRGEPFNPSWAQLAQVLKVFGNVEIFQALNELINDHAETFKEMKAAGFTAAFSSAGFVKASCHPFRCSRNQRNTQEIAPTPRTWSLRATPATLAATDLRRQEVFAPVRLRRYDEGLILQIVDGNGWLGSQRMLRRQDRHEGNVD